MDACIEIIDVRGGKISAIEDLRTRTFEGLSSDIEGQVRAIVDAVRTRGDAALVEYERQFDCPTLTAAELVVGVEEIDEAYKQVDTEWIGAFRRAKENVFEYHSRLLQSSWLDSFEGMLLGQRIRPMASAGLYVPAKHAPLPSTLCMCAVPARVAGVPRLALATPPRKDGTVDPTMLVAAAECGVDDIYRMGGAQGIAALAYGTESIEPVAMVVGPGSPWVVMAKRLVFGVVGIESLPGPSESLIIADELQDVELVAADLLSQAEHTGDNTVILLTPSEYLARAVSEALGKQVEKLSRSELTAQSLQEYGAIVIVDSLEQACEIANDIAPEHLQILTADPFAWLELIENAGCICLGSLSAVPLGDYAAGPSHVLPTNGTARFSSPLSVDDFVKKSSVIYATPRGFNRLAQDVETLAEAEGLGAHAAAIRMRREAG
jgi:histidinol dehydrogenase